MREPAEMREFLLNEEWRETSPWSGPWSPRGSRYVVSTFLHTCPVRFVPTTLTALFSFNRFSPRNATLMKHDAHHGVRSANILAKYAKLSATVYGWLAIMPRWLMLVITGTIASTILNLLHGNDEQPKQKAQNSEEVPEWAKEQEAAATADTTKAAQVASAGEEGSEHRLKESPAKGSTSSSRKRKGKK